MTVARHSLGGPPGDERIPVRLHAARYVIAVATFACAWLLAPPLAALLISLLVITGALLDVRGFSTSTNADRDRFELLWELSDDALAFLDADGRVNKVTSAFERFFGQERASILGRTLAELAPDSELARVVSAAARGARDVAQLTLRNGEGERVPVDIVSHRLDAGSLLLALRPTVPVAPPAEAPKAAAATAPETAVLGATIERAAHDLNNILSAISGNLDLARQDVGPVHPARESLDEILSATRRARGVASTLAQASPRRTRTVSDQVPVTTANPVPARASAISETGKLVLYLDDDETLTDIIGRLLARRGHRVAAHTDVPRALADFRSRASEFALVVTDLNLPNASGFDVAREVRAIRPEMRVVLVSGFFRAEELDAAQAVGVDGTLLKASSAHEFAADIARYLTR